MGDALIVIATLELPVMLGVELITLIIYPTPAGVLQGMVQVIVPAAIPVNVPIETGAAKLPAAFDNCAVNVFPAVKTPVIVNGTLTVAHEQNGLPVIEPVVIVCPESEKGESEITNKKNKEILNTTLQLAFEFIIFFILLALKTLLYL